MFAENVIVKHSHDIILIITIFLLQVAKQFKLYTRLMLKPLLIPDDFYGDHLVSFVVKTFQSLAKTTRA